MAQAEHSIAQREFIARRLARFWSPGEIVIAFEKRYPGIRCTEADVLACDPRDGIVQPEVHAAFFSEREKILEGDIADAPFAAKNARVYALSQMAEWFISTNRPEDARTVFRHIQDELDKPISGDDDHGAPGATSPKPITAVTRTVVDPVPAG